MSQIHYQDLTLEEMIRRASAVIVVSKREPFRVEEKIAIDEDPQKCPPFTKVTYNFRVKQVLFGDNNAVAEGKDIVAVDQTTGTYLTMHKKYHLEGISKSPIFEHYDTKADFIKDRELILFTSIIGRDELNFISYESVSKKKDVLAIIKKLDRRPGSGPIYPSEPETAPRKPNMPG